MLLFAGGATAGTRNAPEIEDAEGDTTPTAFAGADILAVWFTEANFTLTVTMEVADLRDPLPSSRYAVAWHERDARRAVTMDVDEQQRMHVRYGLENGTQSYGRGEVEVDYTTDAPGLITVQIPRRVLLANGGDALRNFTAHAESPRFERGPFDGQGWQDGASSGSVFVLKRVYDPVYASPVAAVGAVLAGLAAAACALPRRR